MATSQNGWPVIESGTSKYLTRVPKIIGKVRADGNVAEVFTALITYIDQHVEDVDQGRDDWGYAYRPIRGQSSGFSNHASGTAIDLNALLHPRGARGTWTVAQKRLVHAFLRGPLRGTVRWGEDYDPRLSKVDGMHFEIDASAAELAEVVKGLKGSDYKPAGGSAKPAEPTPDPTAETVKANSGNSKADNRAIARFLNANGFDAGYPDGVPGPRLRAGVKAYQDAQVYFPGMKRDGDWGPMLQAHFDWVKDLQEAVGEWKASDRLGVLVEDGSYARVTAAHVKAVQRDNAKLYAKHGGVKFDGLAGPITCQMLGIRQHPSA